MTILPKPGQKNFFNLVFSENKKNKILILVLCSRNYLSCISSKAQKQVWNKASEEFDIIHYVGSSDTSVRELNYIKENSNEYLIIQTGDEYSNIGQKTLLAFEQVVLNYDFDYIFVCLSPMYVHYKNWKYFKQMIDIYEKKTGKKANVIDQKYEVTAKSRLLNKYIGIEK